MDVVRNHATLQSALGLPFAGERRVVTVVFADIVASSKIVQSLSDEQAALFLEHAVQDMVAAATTFEAAIVKENGDGIMAVFGTPSAQEDHALRAIMAALMIRDTFADPARYGDAGRVNVRIGLHSGAAMFRPEQMKLARTANALGETVNTASHIEQFAAPQVVTISQVTHEMVAGKVISRPAGEAKSGDIVMPVFAVEALAGELTHMTNFGVRNRTPLYGRADVFQRLQRFVAQAWRGEAPVLGISGEAGLGKSRLAFETELIAARARLNIEHMRGVEVDTHTPFASLRGTLRRHFVQRTATTPQAMAGALGVLGLNDHHARALTALTIGTSADELIGQLHPDERLEAIANGFSAFLMAVSRERPTLLLVDDLHDIDAESQLCLKRIVHGAHRNRPAVLVSTRPHADASLRAVAAARITLQPLVPDDVQDLALAELKRLNLPGDHGDIARDIAMRSQGSPLMLEELLKTLAGALPGEPPSSLPLSIESAMQARISASSVAAQGIAAAASIIGTEIDVDLLHAVCAYDRAVFDTALKEVLSARIMQAQPNGKIAFVHPLMAEACSAMLVSANREALHKRVYEAIMASDPSRFSHQTLARHAELGAQSGAAIYHLRKACSHSINTAAISTAASLHERAIDLAQRSPDSEDSHYVDFVLRAFDPFQQVARHSELIGHLKRTLEICARTGRQREAVQAELHLSMATWIGGQHKRALKLAQSGHCKAQELGDDDLPIRTYAEFILATTEYATGRVHIAGERLHQLSESLSGKLGQARFGAIGSMGIIARCFGAWYLFDAGRDSDAEALLSQAKDLLEQSSQTYPRLLVITAQGYRHLIQGDFQLAAERLSVARDICHRNGHVGMELTVSAWLGEALVHVGKSSAAIEMIQDSLDAPWAPRIRTHGAMAIRNALTNAYIAQGELETAGAALKSGLQLARGVHDPVNYCRLLKTRAVLGQLGSTPEWQRDARAARTLALRCGVPALWREADALI